MRRSPGQALVPLTAKEMTSLFDWLPGTEDRLREMLDQGLLFERTRWTSSAN
jgi:hypothetical protein